MKYIGAVEIVDKRLNSSNFPVLLKWNISDKIECIDLVKNIIYD